MAEQIQTTILRNSTKMALEFVRPAGCEDCVGAKTAICNLVELAVENSRPVRESVSIFKEQFVSQCQGMVPTEEVRDCMPSLKCGHKLGAYAIGTMCAAGSLWKDELTLDSKDLASEEN